MSRYLVEPYDHSDRYATERYQGAQGRNWWRCDPTLRLLMRRLLDGGATEGGRPYFVMELVKGVPITKFCDERKLTPRERLELFVLVCQANGT